MKPCPPQGRGVFPGTKLAGHSGSLGKARKNAWTLRQPAKNSNGVAAPRTLEEVHQAGKKRSSYPLPPGTNPPHPSWHKACAAELCWGSWITTNPPMPGFEPLFDSTPGPGIVAAD